MQVRSDGLVSSSTKRGLSGEEEEGAQIEGVSKMSQRWLVLGGVNVKMWIIVKKDLNANNMVCV